ncbi:tail fiber assembly protein [Pseudomonas agarici]|uniref:tail fiber assembly protein n=1 Tax=Pseudomonas agarici TaxID=46677 RepID=UPI00159FAC44|nr:tail fiber assembly protein [Pseudomonas agarici]NWB92343.1 tail fiber assembly protein [Pseudomonas agarici]
MSSVDLISDYEVVLPMRFFDDENGVYMGAFSYPFQPGFPPDNYVEVEAPHDILPSPEQVLAMALSKRDALLTLAALRIAPLQDAVDLDDATASEVASLTLWKQYRVAVNRVIDQPGFPEEIDWPTPPAA